MRSPVYSQLITIIAVLGAFVLGISADAVRHALKDNACESEFALLDRDEICGRHTDVIRKTSYAGTDKILRDYIKGQEEVGHVTDVAVYFRDLENGPIFGINDDAEFAPASLLKLPLALTYFDEYDANPALFDEQVRVERPDWQILEVHYPPPDTIDPRASHSVRDLLERMLKYSDTNAFGVLAAHLYEMGGSKLLTRSLIDFGIIDPTSTGEDVLSVRRYAAIYRALYTASYLNISDSQQVLSWLSESTFSDGLRKGVPADVKIAHKFGERPVSDTERQLHDCGIIYYPVANPYLLCVMTKGKEYAKLSDVIGNISKIMFEEIRSRRI